MSESVLTDITDGVMTVTLNEPESMNALSPAVSSGLLGALDRASKDDDARVMILTGAGRGFCAGATVGGSGFGGARDDANPTASRHSRMERRSGSATTVEAFASCDVPVIAAINGAAAGAGFGISLCCDVRFMAQSARIGSIFIKRGIASDYGAAYWLPRMIGISNAYEVMYDGSLMTADRCLELGIVQHVVPDDLLLEKATEYARGIAAGPPMAYTALRRMLQRSTTMHVSDFVEYEWTAQAALLPSKDVAEGFGAFLERRDPEFTGQ